MASIARPWTDFANVKLPQQKLVSVCVACPPPCLPAGDVV